MAALLGRLVKIGHLAPAIARKSRILQCSRLLVKPGAHVRTLGGQISPNIVASQALVQAAAPAPEEVEPLKHPDYFEVHKMFTVRDLFDARVHLGHREGTLNDHMRPFLFGFRLGHAIFDLDQTAFYLRAALNFAAFTAFQKGVILFVNRNAQNSHAVELAAAECGEYAHTRHWFRGTLTNANAERGPATRLPDLLVFTSTLGPLLNEHVAVPHAAKMLIPSVGVVDSNCDPRLVTYPVPGNDDTPCAVALYCDLFKKAVLKGKQKRKELDAKGVVAKDLE